MIVPKTRTGKRLYRFLFWAFRVNSTTLEYQCRNSLSLLQKDNFLCAGLMEVYLSLP